MFHACGCLENCKIFIAPHKFLLSIHRGYKTLVKPLQDSFVLMKGYPDLVSQIYLYVLFSLSLVHLLTLSLSPSFSCSQVLKHMSHRNIKISVQIMAFLYTLVFNGNKTTQDTICNLIADDSSFFLSIHRLITIILQYSHNPKLVFESTLL